MSAEEEVYSENKSWAPPDDKVDLDPPPLVAPAVQTPHRCRIWLQPRLKNAGDWFKVRGRMVAQDPWIIVLPLTLMCIMMGLGLWGVLGAADSTERRTRERATSDAEATAESLLSQLNALYPPIMTLSTLAKLHPARAEFTPRWRPACTSSLSMMPPTVSKAVQRLWVAPQGTITFSLNTTPGVDMRGLPVLQVDDEIRLLAYQLVAAGAGVEVLPNTAEAAARDVAGTSGKLLSDLFFLRGPYPEIGTSRRPVTLYAGTGIFLATNNSDENWGWSSLYQDMACLNKSTGVNYCYNKATGYKLWGVSGINYDLEQLVQTSSLTRLTSSGYRWALRKPIITPPFSLISTNATPPHTIASSELVGNGEGWDANWRAYVAQSGPPLTDSLNDPYAITINLMHTQWELRIEPEQGWVPSWRAPLIAVVVIVSVVLPLLLFILLVSRRQHKLLLEALVPRNVIRHLWHQGEVFDRRGMGVYMENGTPAAKMLDLVTGLLEGRLPSTQDALLVRTAILQAWDLYQPVGGWLEEQLAAQDLDNDVTKALMHTLGGLPQRYGGSSLHDLANRGGSVDSARDRGTPGSRSTDGTPDHLHALHALITGGPELAVERSSAYGRPITRSRHSSSGASPQVGSVGTREGGVTAHVGAAPSVSSSGTYASAAHVLGMVGGGGHVALPPNAGAPSSAGGRSAGGEAAPLVALASALASTPGQGAGIPLTALAPAPGAREAPRKLSSLVLSSTPGSLPGMEGTVGSHTALGLGPGTGTYSQGPSSTHGPSSARADSITSSTGARDMLATGGSRHKGGMVHSPVVSDPGKLYSVDGPLGVVQLLMDKEGPGTEEEGEEGEGAGTTDGGEEEGDGHAGDTRTSEESSSRRAKPPADGRSGSKADSSSGIVFLRTKQAGDEKGGMPMGGMSSKRISRWGSARPADAAAEALAEVEGGAAGGGAGHLALRAGGPSWWSTTGGHGPPSPSVPPPIMEEVERVLASAASSWTMDAFALAEVTRGHPLSTLAYYLIVQDTRLAATHKLSLRSLAHYLRAIEAGYRSNPYHNAAHAADVLQTLHVILTRSGLLAHYADPLTHLACYLAAVVHDYEHVGRTNDFLINTRHALAMLYNDRSPMENHHAAAALTLMSRPEIRLLDHLPRGDRDAVRRIVIELVMGTDMKQHLSIVSHFTTVHRLHAHGPSHGPLHHQPSHLRGSNQVAEDGLVIGSHLSVVHSESDAAGSHGHAGAGAGGGGGDSTRTWGPAGAGGKGGVHASASSVTAAPRVPVASPLDEAERLLTLQVAFKCADLGHMAEDLATHRKWVDALEEEFFRQGDAEKVVGLPPSPLFDRNAPGITKSQPGFIDFVVYPLYRAFTHVFPPCRLMLSFIDSNYQYWQSQAVLAAAGHHGSHSPVASPSVRTGGARTDSASNVVNARGSRTSAPQAVLSLSQLPGSFSPGNSPLHTSALPAALASSGITLSPLGHVSAGEQSISLKAGGEPGSSGVVHKASGGGHGACAPDLERGGSHAGSTQGPGPLRGCVSVREKHPMLSALSSYMRNLSTRNAEMGSKERPHSGGFDLGSPRPGSGGYTSHALRGPTGPPSRPASGAGPRPSSGATNGTQPPPPKLPAPPVPPSP